MGQTAQRAFQMHAATWAAVNGFLFLVWLLTTPGGFPWFLFPAGGWGIALAIHAVSTFGDPGDDDDELGRGSSAAPLPSAERWPERDRVAEPDPSEDLGRYRTLGE